MVTEHHTLVSLPQAPAPQIATISSHILVASGLEKHGRDAICNIAHIVFNETPILLDEKAIRNRALLVQKEWIKFLNLFDYEIINMITSPHEVYNVVLDMGELPEVIEMAPILLKSSNIFYFICLDLSCENKPLVSLAYSEQIAKQCIHRVIESVTKFKWPWATNRAARECYTAAIVGVHSGKNQQLVTSELHRVDANLKMLVQSCGSDKAIQYCCHQQNQMIFSLDLHCNLNDETSTKKAIRKIVRKSNKSHFEIHAYIFINILNLRGGVMSYSECKYVARLFGISDRQLTHILKDAHNKLGMLLHFREVPKLKNLVICHSQELTIPLKSFTEVALNGTPSLPQDLAIVRKKAEISTALINELISLEKPVNKLPVSCLLELLKYYKFLSEVERVDGTTVYFMPSLLQPCPLLSSQLSVEEQNTASLLFCYKHGHSPHSSLFTALIAQLARNWKLANVDRYKDFITFVADTSLLTKVEVYDRGDHIQLVVVGPESQIPQWYSQIRHEMQRALYLVKMRFAHLASEVCHIGFYCPQSLYSVYPPHCTLVRIAADGVAYLQCTVQNCQKECFCLQPRMGIWFAGDQVSNTDVSVLGIDTSFLLQKLTEKSVDGFANILQPISLFSSKGNTNYYGMRRNIS